MNDATIYRISGDFRVACSFTCLQWIATGSLPRDANMVGNKNAQMLNPMLLFTFQFTLNSSLLHYSLTMDSLLQKGLPMTRVVFYHETSQEMGFHIVIARRERNERSVNRSRAE